MCFVGYVAAKYGMITQEIEKGMAGLIIRIFMPCLLFANIADLDMDTLTKLWIIPVAYFFFASCSGLLGLIGGKLLRFQPSNIKFLCVSIIFNNVTSLSLGILEGLSKTKAIELLSFGDGDTPSEIKKRGTSYILLITLWTNLLRVMGNNRWSLGAYLLKKESTDETDQIQKSDNEGETSPHESHPGENSTKYDDDRSISVHMPPDESTPLITPMRPHPIRAITEFFGKVMNPPLCAALLAVIVGVVPFLRSLFFGSGAPLTAVTLTIESFGSISVPLTLLTLGAQLKNIPRTKSAHYWSIGYTMLSRFIAMPIIGIVIVLATRHLYLEDPMLLFVLVMLASGPTAVNCMNLAQFTGTFQEEMATLLFYSYIAAAPTITLLVVGLLSIIGKKPFETGLERRIKVVSSLVAILENDYSRASPRKKHPSGCAIHEYLASYNEFKTTPFSRTTAAATHRVVNSISMPSHNKPSSSLFNYPSFIKHLNYDRLFDSIDHWCKLEGYIPNTMEIYVMRALLRLMTDNGATLTTFKVHPKHSNDPRYCLMYEPEICGLFKEVRFLDHDGCCYKRDTILPELVKICKNVKHLRLCGWRSPNLRTQSRLSGADLTHFISKQSTLISLNLTECQGFTPYVLSGLSSQTEFLKCLHFDRVNFEGCDPWNFIAECKNLEVLKMASCYNIDAEMVEPILKAKFRKLRKVEIFKVECKELIEWSNRFNRLGNVLRVKNYWS
ncbi:7316_t:CDS:2 [Acaulospora colombiana]|uniref:7316_t:CDS:1 n=1 Tax=Acaulospora colombiana TaxID=27376 RepID=A0ACA9LST8_9GLOM|nr:7316_t:CDS:2 [Acaulospora colombiana]